MRLRDFTGELRRRRVPQVCAAYVAGGFVAAQAADLFFPHLGLPPRAVTFVIVLIVLGLPVALVLAWVFDVVPEAPAPGAAPTGPAAAAGAAAASGAGPRERRPLRRPAAAALLAVTSALALVAAIAFMRRPANALLRDRVVVAAFENHTGRPALDPIGSLAADWVAQGLAQSGMVDVVPAAAAFAFAAGMPDQTRGAGALASAVALARETGAGTVVWGGYYEEGGRLQLRVQISDAETGELLGSLDPVGARADSVSTVVADLAHRVAGALATILDPRLAGWIDVRGQPPNLESYRAYAGGMEAYIRYDYAAAASAFERAVLLDSTFHVARLWLAHSLANGIDRPRADSIAGVLALHPERLSAYDRAFLDRLRARLRGDWRAAYAAAVRMTEAAPASQDAWRERGLDAIRLNRPAETVRIFESLDPERGWLRGYPDYWTWLAEARHLLGDYKGELRSAREGLRRYPDWAWLHMREAIALAALGRSRELRSVLDGFPAAQPALLLGLGVELLTHGQGDAGLSVLRRALYEQRLQLRAGPATLAGRVAELEMLYYAGELEEAEQHGRGLLGSVREGEAALVHGILGAIAARRGSDAAVRAHLAALAEMPPRYMSGRHTYWRARISALRGERDAAVMLLRQAFGEGLQPVFSTSGGMVTPHVAPEFESLRGDPRFQQLVRPEPH